MKHLAQQVYEVCERIDDYALGDTSLLCLLNMDRASATALFILRDSLNEGSRDLLIVIHQTRETTTQTRLRNYADLR